MGNGNQEHINGAKFSYQEKEKLLEYLKTLTLDG
jgi:hypothetical protein